VSEQDPKPGDRKGKELGRRGRWASVRETRLRVNKSGRYLLVEGRGPLEPKSWLAFGSIGEKKESRALSAPTRLKEEALSN